MEDALELSLRFNASVKNLESTKNSPLWSHHYLLSENAHILIWSYRGRFGVIITIWRECEQFYSTRERPHWTYIHWHQNRSSSDQARWCGLGRVWDKERSDRKFPASSCGLIRFDTFQGINLLKDTPDIYIFTATASQFVTKEIPANECKISENENNRKFVLYSFSLST